MVPGPTSVPAEVLAAYALDYGSGDLEDEFFALYDRVQQQLRHILATRNQVAVMTGEGMLALWAGLKSCLRPDDWVLAVATGLFGDGIGEMARALGAEVEIVSFPHDTVASAAGARLCTDDWRIDLCAVGSQKCLSAPPGLAIVAVSPRAWRVITPHWHALAALEAATRRVLDEGLDQVLERHARVAAACRRGVRRLGLELYPRDEAFSSPTVTAVQVPPWLSWPALDTELRRRGSWSGATTGRSRARSSASATWARKPTSTWSSGRSRRSPRPCVGPPEATGRRKSIVALRTATRKSWKPSGCPSVSTSVVGSRSGARVGSLAS